MSLPDNGPVAGASIPGCDPCRRFSRFRNEISAALESVRKSGVYILGPQVEAFEAEFAAYLGVPYCIGVASGTDAVTLALMGLGIGPGDEVITPALTAHGTAVGICRSGATPVFVDVDRQTRCLNPEAVASAVSPHTAAIVLVHLHGRPGPVDGILAIAQRAGLAVVEDAAQAHGAQLGKRRIGSLGNAAAFSFYPTKNLGCMGDGGAVVTTQPEVAGRVRRARCYGWDAQRVSDTPGLNSRLDELHAAVLRVLLPALDAYNSERRAVAARYLCELAGLPLGFPAESPGAVYHQFVVEVANRNAFRQWLAEGGIGTDIHYPLGLHHMPAFPQAALPVTDALASGIVSLPIQPEVAADNLERILARIKEWQWQQRP